MAPLRRGFFIGWPEWKEQSVQTMATARRAESLYGNWTDLKGQAPAVSTRLSDFVNFRDTADALAPEQQVALVDVAQMMTAANLKPVAEGEVDPSSQTPDQTLVEVPQGEVEGLMPEVSPEPETITPEVTPEPETITPEVSPEPETVTPEVTPEPETLTPEVSPEPETVTPEVPLAPDQSIPTIDGSTDQGLIDVNPIDPKIAEEPVAEQPVAEEPVAEQPVVEAVAEATPQVAVDFESMTKAQIVDYCATNYGVTLDNSQTKAELVDQANALQLEDSQTAPSSEPVAEAPAV